MQAFRGTLPAAKMSRKGLMEQDLSKLDVTKLHPLSPEVISRQATINIGKTFWITSMVKHIHSSKKNSVFLLWFCLWDFSCLNFDPISE